MEMFVQEVGLDHRSWQEIDGWIQATGSHVSRWEAVALMDMSRVYHSAIAKYDQTDTPSPWLDKDFDREAVANQMRRALRGK